MIPGAPLEYAPILTLSPQSLGSRSVLSPLHWKRILSDPSPQEPEDPPSGGRPYRDASHLTLGFEFSVSIALFGVLGWFLDRWTGMLETFPVFLLVGVFLGLGLGIYRLQLKLNQGSKTTSQDDPSQEDPEA